VLMCHFVKLSDLNYVHIYYFKKTS
jgi:hypothetical protein